MTYQSTDMTAQARAPERRRDLTFVSVGLLVLLLGLAAVLSFFPNLYFRLIVSEQGIPENATVLIAVIGAGFAGSLFLRRDRMAHPVLGYWFLLFVVGLLFLAGEEASWGQQWLRWQSPEFFQENNLQQETNLHNMALWLESVPKLSLVIAVAVTGLIYPALKRLKGVTLPQRIPLLRDIWPTPALWPCAVIAFGFRVAERIVVWSVEIDPIRHQVKVLKETHELFLVLFVTLYLFDVWRRTRQPGEARV